MNTLTHILSMLLTLSLGANASSLSSSDPVPVGAATAANQITAIASLATIASKLSAPVGVIVTTSASVALTSALLVDSNPNRKGFIIWNNSANSAYITFGPTSVGTTPTYILPTFQSLTFIYPVTYTGKISAIRNAGSGTMTVYELQ